MQNKIKLKPCPFCGSFSIKISRDKKGRCWQVCCQCKTCNAKSATMIGDPYELYEVLLDDAVSAWNRRSAEKIIRNNEED